MSRIEHFAIFADDLESLRAFYEEAFGLRVVVDNSRAPIAGYFLADDASTYLEIIARPKGTAAADTRYVCHVAFPCSMQVDRQSGRGWRIQPEDLTPRLFGTRFARLLCRAM